MGEWYCYRNEWEVIITKFPVRLNYCRPRKSFNNAKSGTEEQSRFKFIIIVSSVSIINITPDSAYLYTAYPVCTVRVLDKLVTTPFCIYLSKRIKFFVNFRFTVCG